MTKLRKFARDQQCTLRISGVCNGDPATTVLAHGKGAGMGTKLHDECACHACSECHYYLDHIASPAEYRALFWPAQHETYGRAKKAGLVQ